VIDPSAPWTNHNWNNWNWCLPQLINQDTRISIPIPFLCEIQESPGIAISINNVLVSLLIIYVISGILCANDEPGKWCYLTKPYKHHFPKHYLDSAATLLHNIKSSITGKFSMDVKIMKPPHHIMRLKYTRINQMINSFIHWVTKVT